MTLPRPAPGVVDMAVDDEQVLWLGGELHLLDATGALIWRLMPHADDLEELAQVLVEATDADSDDVRNGIAALLHHLSAVGVLCERSGGSARL